MRNSKMINKTAVDKDNKTVRRFVYSLIFIAALILVAVYLHPFRSYAASFDAKGDEFLLQKDFDNARLQYEKALIVNPNDTKAKERLELMSKGKDDILAMKDFYIEKNCQEELDKIELATSVPATETEALKISKKFIDQGDFQLALIPAQTALQMDPDYKEAKEFILIIKEHINSL